MAIDLELAPKVKRPAGEPCCEPVVYPDVEREQAIRMAEVRRRSAIPCGCSWSTSSESTRARPACASVGLLLRAARCAGGTDRMAELTDRTPDLRETVRARYAAAARATTEPTEGAGCCSPDAAVISDEQAELFGASQYADS